jgi:hypothetical protein
MCGNLNFASRREKTKKSKQLPKLPEAHVHGWVHTPDNNLIIICLPKVAKSPNR